MKCDKMRYPSTRVQLVGICDLFMHITSAILKAEVFINGKLKATNLSRMQYRTIGDISRLSLNDVEHWSLHTYYYLEE